MWDMVSPSPRPSSRRPAPRPRWGGPRTLAPLWGFGVPAVPIRQPFPSLPPRSHQLAAPFPPHSQHLWGGGSRWGPSCQLIPQRGSSRPPLQCSPSQVLAHPGVPLQLPVAVPTCPQQLPQALAQGPFVPAGGWRGDKAPQSPLPLLLHQPSSLESLRGTPGRAGGSRGLNAARQLLGSAFFSSCRQHGECFWGPGTVCYTNYL